MAVQASEIDDTLKRLSSRKGVKAVVILNSEGQAIRSTLDPDLTKQYGQLISSLAQQARSAVTTLDEQARLDKTRLVHVCVCVCVCAHASMPHCLE